MACLMGFHLTGEHGVRKKTEDFGPTPIFRILFVFSSCFCHWAAEKGEYRFRLILQSHTHVHLMLYRPFVLTFFCPHVFCASSAMPCLSPLSCFHACPCPAMTVFPAMDGSVLFLSAV
jgi:hypothetical protein